MNYKQTRLTNYTSMTSYQALFSSCVRQKGVRLNPNQAEPLASMDYEVECDLKKEAMKEFWKKNHISGPAFDFIPSPRPRGYRTTTKRSVYLHQEEIRLGFQAALPVSRLELSLLEPDQHNRIYQLIAENLNSDKYRYLGKILNYVIIRGNEDENCLILNVRKLSGKILRDLEVLSGLFRDNPPFQVKSCFVYLDPGHSEYYLDTHTEEEEKKYKKIWGSDKIFMKVCGLKYSYPPVSFSQINPSILPSFLEHVYGVFERNPSWRLLDLYCGYGLFTHYLKKLYNEIYAFDYDKKTIQSAIDNARFIPPKKRMNFFACRIEPRTIEKLCPQDVDISEDILLDPPKNGCGEEVIDYCSKRKPQTVVHIYCGTDEIPSEMERWHRNGYRIQNVRVFDMFPGTVNLETVVFLRPK